MISPVLLHPERVRGPQGLTPTQVQDDLSSRLTEQEEDEEKDMKKWDRMLGGSLNGVISRAPVELINEPSSTTRSSSSDASIKD